MPHLTDASATTNLPWTMPEPRKVIWNNFLICSLWWPVIRIVLLEKRRALRPPALVFGSQGPAALDIHSNALPRLARSPRRRAAGGRRPGGRFSLERIDFEHLGPSDDRRSTPCATREALFRFSTCRVAVKVWSRPIFISASPHHRREQFRDGHRRVAATECPTVRLRE